MNLHEFQAKELLARFSIPAPKGRVASSAPEAERIARKLSFRRYAVKAQVHAGERGANGGVLFADDPKAVFAAAERLLGRPLVTSQTAPSGQMVRLVYIEEAVMVARALYAAVVVDTTLGRLVLLLSGDGGDQIERHAEASPGVIIRTVLSAGQPLGTGVARRLAGELGLDGSEADDVAGVLMRLVEAAQALDARLVEVNPLAITESGQVLALDAKMEIDENAMFRQPDLAGLRDVEAAETGDPLELAAQQHQINYLRMDGEIGVVVNGAGLALATLDTLSECGGRAANFMDIRTTASSQDIAYGLRLILGNPTTRVVLVNVHGGGMQNCDTIAEGIAIAVRSTNRVLPLVVRLAGNNADFARTRLAGSGIAFEDARSMRDAAERAVAIANREAA